MYSHLQEAMDAASPGDTIGIQVSGNYAVNGPPLDGPVLTPAGDDCFIEVTLPYELTGTLEVTGSDKETIRIHGPCGVPPGTFDEDHIALAELAGSLDGVEGSFTGIADWEVRHGGINDGLIVGTLTLGDGTGGLAGIRGELATIGVPKETGTYSGKIWIDVPPAMAVNAEDPNCDAPGDDVYCHLPEAIDAALPGDTIGVQVSGNYAVNGPPLAGPVFTPAGDDCFIEVTLPYELTGTLEVAGSDKETIRIHGPCGVPPGTFDEDHIALAELAGSLDGVEGSFTGIADWEVRHGGINDGLIIGTLTLGDGTGGLAGIRGELETIGVPKESGTYGGQIFIDVQPMAGDANRDGLVDQHDIVQVLEGGKYNTGEPADFSQGDFNGDGLFNQFDVIAALQTGAYLQSQ